MAEIVTLNAETVVDFLRRNSGATTDAIKNRFALSDKAVRELLDGLEEMGHIKRGWLVGDLWNLI